MARTRIKRDHNNPPHPYKDRHRMFVQYCAENITEWRTGMKSIVCRRGWKFRQYWWRERHDGLCYDWTVCTRKAWIEARSKLCSQDH